MIFLDWTVDLLFDRDITRLKVIYEKPIEEFKEVDDVW
jgi:NADH:ubiquinone reductase (H+-translocating)